MESRFDRRELLFQPRGIPPLGTSLSLALQHLVAMIVGCVTPPIIIAGAIGLSQEEQVLLIQASLVMSAVCTFLQLYPIGGRFGSGLPGDPGCQLCLCSQYAGHRRLRRRSGGHCRRHDRGRHRGCAGGRVRQEDPPAVPGRSLPARWCSPLASPSTLPPSTTWPAAPATPMNPWWRNRG